MRKIGINLNAKLGLTNEEYIRLISQLGFTATFTGNRDPQTLPAIGESCAKYGVICETLHAPFGHINDIWLPGDDGDAMLCELKLCVDHCGIVGAGVMVTHLSSGNRAPSITDLGRARFTELVDYAASKNVMIAFENQRKLANLAWALETFDESVAGFCWDCGHEGCFTPGRQYMPLFESRLICTHIHDNSGNYNEDQHLIPFDGSLDFSCVARQLRDSGYQGSLMLEVIAANSAHYDNISVETYLQCALNAAEKLRDMVDGRRSKQ